MPAAVGHSAQPLFPPARQGLPKHLRRLRSNATVRRSRAEVVRCAFDRRGSAQPGERKMPVEEVSHLPGDVGAAVVRAQSGLWAACACAEPPQLYPWRNVDRHVAE